MNIDSIYAEALLFSKMLELLDDLLELPSMGGTGDYNSFSYITVCKYRGPKVEKGAP